MIVVVEDQLVVGIVVVSYCHVRNVNDLVVETSVDLWRDVFKILIEMWLNSPDRNTSLRLVNIRDDSQR